jgi:hypothetical protein
MKRLYAGGTCMAAVLAFGTVALAQEPPTQPPTTQPPTQTAPPAQREMTSPDKQVTIVGCIVKEADYRRAKNLGKGGAVGTGAGAGNEFVLVNASMSPASGAATETPAPTGTAGTPAMGSEEFELTGSNESKAETFVGKRVEIVGTLKAAETGPAGATGGATAGRPPTGIDTTSPDLRLREVEITSVREATGTCPAIR